MGDNLSKYNEKRDFFKKNKNIEEYKILLRNLVGQNSYKDEISKKLYELKLLHKYEFWGKTLVDVDDFIKNPTINKNYFFITNDKEKINVLNFLEGNRIEIPDNNQSDVIEKYLSLFITEDFRKEGKELLTKFFKQGISNSKKGEILCKLKNKLIKKKGTAKEMEKLLGIDRNSKSKYKKAYEEGLKNV